VFKAIKKILAAIMLCGSAAVAGGADLPPAKFEDGPTIAASVIQADFAAWLSGMRLLNPDLGIRADLRALNRQAARIRAELTQPMSRREAWLHFAKLNPYLHDAHAGVQMPGYRDALEAHIKAGGRIVPVEVRFARDGSLRVFATAAGTNDLQPDDQVLSINGHSAEQMIDAMMSRAVGDTPGFQRAFMARRFAMLFWYLYGDTGEYDVVVRRGQARCPVRVRVQGGATLPSALQSRPAAADLFDWRILRGDVGYLRVDSFDPDLKSSLDELTQTAFAAFKDRGIRALIVDVRENGGGDDPLWQQHLVDHFSAKPYVQLSRYSVRVTKDNADKEDVVGTVQTAAYDKRLTPPPVDPVRFAGPVYILAGPYSYSATIQFLVATQDFGLAKIVGEETAALSCQTGKVKRIDLPWTGLAASTPIIAYTRPSGLGCEHGVIPDVPIAIDEVAPGATLNALLDRIDGPQAGGN
jgi:C-terminal processing protease CtpA/Prc